MCHISKRSFKDPILYSNMVFLFASMFVFVRNDILYAFIAFFNFIVSGRYHYYGENRYRLADSLVSKMSVGIFLYDMVRLWGVNPVISWINFMCNLLPLVYCFYMSRVYRERAYELLHIGVHWFATMHAICVHLLK